MGNTFLWRACYRVLIVLIPLSYSNLEMSDVGNVATAVCALKGFFQGHILLFSCRLLEKMLQGLQKAKVYVPRAGVARRLTF